MAGTLGRLSAIEWWRNMKYEYWFANIKGISGKRKQIIRTGMKSLEKLYYIEETALETLGILEQEKTALLDSIRNWDLGGEYRKLEERGIVFLTILDESYPRRLKEIASPPYALYVKGEAPQEHIPTVAIVGARECSAYGEQMATVFGKALAKAGVQVISGMARGVDAAGQWGALEAGGKSYGILGSGVDVCYPGEQRKLYETLQKQGGLISEYPPGTRPMPQHFPARNRIISGLSDAVLVIEAKEKSGSLITADMALEQGKDVYALPGPVTSRLSKGCNELIRQGAGILLSPEMFLEELGINGTLTKENEEQKKLLLESEENIVYSCLGLYPKNTDRLLAETKLSVVELLDVLMRLELKGYVKEITKNHYTRTKQI